MQARYWETKPLAAMSDAEWEALCDGCAKCCLLKLEDADDGTVYFTDVHCFLLERSSCRCGDYANRTAWVPACIRLTPDRLDEVFWMPTSCSYRRLAEGRGLPSWHPLCAGDPKAVHAAGMSVLGRSVAETDVVDVPLEDHMVEWPVTESGDEGEVRRRPRSSHASRKGPKRSKT